MARAILLVMDSVGIGGAPDAAEFGDEGADTLGHIAAACAAGNAGNERRAGPLDIPNLNRLGLCRAAEASTGNHPSPASGSSSSGAPSRTNHPTTPSTTPISICGTRPILRIFTRHPCFNLVQYSQPHLPR